ncbi:uncharacterized protein, partial [Bombus fervidus]|uniref:uncharacterized protein n=1 Tax=Bombus fervidus TaxID=203811 RepID=UPI003AB63160
GLPQDPTGSGSSSSSSSSDLAESDDRNDDDDDDDDNDDDDNDDHLDNIDEENRLARVTAGSLLDHLARRDGDAYEGVVNEERSLEFLATYRGVPYDSRSMSKVTDYDRRYDHQFAAREYTETTLTESVNRLQDYNSSSSSSSANSLDGLCQGHQRIVSDLNRGNESSTRDHYMVPTRDPRELNERILSLFNPQFLPNFNDMMMYVGNQYDARRSPPPRSRSMADGESRLFRSSSCRKKRVGASSMFFRRGLTYETARK